MARPLKNRALLQYRGNSGDFFVNTPRVFNDGEIKEIPISKGTILTSRIRYGIQNNTLRENHTLELNCLVLDVRPSSKKEGVVSSFNSDIAVSLNFQQMTDGCIQGLYSPFLRLLTREVIFKQGTVSYKKPYSPGAYRIFLEKQKNAVVDTVVRAWSTDINAELDRYAEVLGERFKGSYFLSEEADLPPLPSFFYTPLDALKPKVETKDSAPEDSWSEKLFLESLNSLILAVAEATGLGDEAFLRDYLTRKYTDELVGLFLRKNAGLVDPVSPDPTVPTKAVSAPKPESDESASLELKDTAPKLTAEEMAALNEEFKTAQETYNAQQGSLALGQNALQRKKQEFANANPLSVLFTDSDQTKEEIATAEKALTQLKASMENDTGPRLFKISESLSKVNEDARKERNRLAEKATNATNIRRDFKAAYDGLKNASSCPAGPSASLPNSNLIREGSQLFVHLHAFKLCEAVDAAVAAFFAKNKNVNPSLIEAGWSFDPLEGGYLNRNLFNESATMEPSPFRITESSNFRGTLSTPQNALPENPVKVLYTYGDNRVQNIYRLLYGHNFYSNLQCLDYFASGEGFRLGESLVDPFEVYVENSEFSYLVTCLPIFSFNKQMANPDRVRLDGLVSRISRP